MKTALLIPGLDAILAASQIRRWCTFPEVRASLALASGALGALTGGKEDLCHFIESSPRPHLADFERTLVAMTAIQVGIARELEKSLRWDLIVGCSHGDFARSVLAGCIELPTAVDLLWTFGELRKSGPPGRTANVRHARGLPLSEEQLAWIARHDVSLSLWSRFHGTASGSTASIDELRAGALARDLKVKPLLAYPVHSPAMLPIAGKMAEQASRWPIRPPRLPVFSSAYARFIDTADEIAGEAIAGATAPLRWLETVAALARVGVRAYINVGPSTTLAGWLKDDVTIAEAWELLAA
jgi:[acyl-carrier-protein] S-malonyltransferase